MRFFFLNQDGQGMVEYSLIISVIVLGVILAMELFGGGILQLFEKIRFDVESVM